MDLVAVTPAHYVLEDVQNPLQFVGLVTVPVDVFALKVVEAEPVYALLEQVYIAALHFSDIVAL